MNQLKIVAVTTCVSGVAYTYMAADKLVQLAKLHHYNIKIETRGALGVSDQLTEQDIMEADLAIVISESMITDLVKFKHSRLISIAVRGFLENKVPLNLMIDKIKRQPKPTHIEWHEES